MKLTECTTLHAHTPEVTVVGPAGPVRAIRFLRAPGEEGKPARVLTARTVTDVPARSLYLYGARALRGADRTILPDATTVTALSGQTVMLHTADGGKSLTLTDAAGRTLWHRNAQGTVNTFSYEGRDSAGRPLTVSERPAGYAARIRERFTYAPVDVAHQARNLCGALTAHHDNAGYSDIIRASLTGQVLQTAQRLFPPEVELPD